MVGKTTVAVNLAITLVQGGEKTVSVDADLREPRVAGFLGITPDFGLSDVLTGRVDVDRALVPWRGNSSLCVLAAGELPPNPSELVGSQHMADLLDKLDRRKVIVVLDSPALSPATDAAVLSNCGRDAACGQAWQDAARFR